jgi:2-methylcitrate dehydratase PrpD
MLQAKAIEKQDVAAIIAAYLANLRYEHIPQVAIDAAKKCILDTLGVIAGASGTVPGCRELAELILDAGGRPESTIIGFGGKVPAWMAAFANGGMGHGLDYDDIHALVVVHPSACVVPAAFATAERIGNVNGRDFITAVAAGIDITCRMGLSIDWKEDWHLSPVLGAFGCAAAAGKLMELDEARLVDALGIALCQAACTMELNVGLGSNLRGAYPGFAAKGGVLSACMAQKGIAGPKNSLEGKAGLYAVYFRGEYRREAILSELGKRFEGANLRFKPWPACTIIQSYIDATLGLVNDHDIHPEDVEKVTAFIGDFGQPLCEPLPGRQKPATTLDAKFSIPFTVAAAIARRNVIIADYTVEGLKNPVTLGLAQKVIPVFREDLKKSGDIYPAEIEIKTKKGTFRKRVDIPYGHPQRPMTRAAISEKFKDCVSYSAKPLPEKHIRKVVEQVSGLQDVSNVSEIMALMG